MPAYSFTSLAKDPKGGVTHHPVGLQESGPRLPCEVRIDATRAGAHVKSDQVAPPGVLGQIMVDTGASVSCVDKDILIGLGISPIGECEVLTPQGKDVQDIYVCGLDFPGTGLDPIPKIFVLGSDLKGHGAGALLGRDVLASGVLVYNGIAGHWVISF